jgi:esterase/lipase superfamily enzyme
MDQPLMPTPVIYEVYDVGPLDHIPEGERWNLRTVYYATTRAREPSRQRIDYSNDVDTEINVGLAGIGFGERDMSWSDLNQASREPTRDREVLLSIAGIFETGGYRIDDDGDVVTSHGATEWLAAELRKQIAASRSGDVMVYVHGAKVNFYNACVFAAQLDHFMGRDMTSVAFSWPTRQSIFAYAFGEDLQRSYDAAPALVSLLELLAERTQAQRIHVLSWSAGGRVLTRAMDVLRKRHTDLSANEMRARFRLGTVYFAAADVPVGEFVSALPAMNETAERIVVTAVAQDDALRTSQIFMGGDSRVGLLNPGLTEQQRQIVLATDRLEYVDMSRGAAQRGFDISGHRYWFDHPWASTDALLSIRTGLEPRKRGLESTEPPVIWWMPDDYPERLREVSVPIRPLERASHHNRR